MSSRLLLETLSLRVGWSSPPAAGPLPGFLVTCKQPPLLSSPPPSFPWAPRWAPDREEALQALGVQGRPRTWLLSGPFHLPLQKDDRASGGGVGWGGHRGLGEAAERGINEEASRRRRWVASGVCVAARGGRAWMKDRIPLPALSWGPRGRGAP